ncbi:MAG: Ig-like domain-containing protein [Gemmatimonadaceae bacterium]
MILSLFAFVGAMQVPQGAPQVPPVTLPASPVARIAITPRPLQVIAGDTLRLRAEAFDSSGKKLDDIKMRFVAAGGRFEGAIDTTGLVHSGSTGTLPVAVVALVPGRKPMIERVEVKMVAGPAFSVAIAPAVPKLVVGQQFKLGAESYSVAHDKTRDKMTWTSSAPGVARVGEDGMVHAVGAGRATISARAGPAGATMDVQVVANTIATIALTPERATARQGDVIRFSATAKDAGGKVIAGLSPSWSFAPGEGAIDADGAFVGYNAGAYVVTATLGGRSATATVTLDHRDVRRPLTVVGRLGRSQFTTEEVWLHPDGKHAYLGTGSGGDRMYAIDISNPAKPTVTDSIMANTRRVNDIMTTADGKLMVFTREGASDRKNGIVIASLEDPAHPKVISEFTDGVTAGVHSSFVYTQPKFGTHAYITNDGTGALHIIDLGDPYHPKEVAQWRTPRADAGRTLHDIDIQNGLLYASYWNDGLVVLDIGNGVKGGSPSNPQLVSQFKYDLNELYRDVEATGGPGFIRGTHTAWRHKNYVFIADEVFPSKGVTGAKDAAAGRAYGRLQVVDVSDIAKPRIVAWYEPEFGGVHNIWVAGDTLYMGAYNAGFRVFDISGELRGDLRAQAREIGHLNPADMDGKVQNAAMTWGVVVRDGLAYVNDMYNGLWVVRIEPKALTP